VNTAVNRLYPFKRSTIKIFPNPIEDLINIILNTDKQQEVSLELYDINGQVIKSVYNGLLSKGENLIQINTNNIYILAGFYFIKPEISLMVNSVTGLNLSLFIYPSKLYNN